MTRFPVSIEQLQAELEDRDRKIVELEAYANLIDGHLAGCRKRCERMKSLEGLSLDEVAQRQIERETTLRQQIRVAKCAMPNEARLRAFEDTTRQLLDAYDELQTHPTGNNLAAAVQVHMDELRALVEEKIEEPKS